MSGGAGSKPRAIQLQHWCARVKAALVQHNADLTILVGDTLPSPPKNPTTQQQQQKNQPTLPQHH